MPIPTDRATQTWGRAATAEAKTKANSDSSEEIDPDSTITINTQLVTLNVRVIDRNNKPIDNVQKSDFHVYEDGVPQPIESLDRGRSAD